MATTENWTPAQAVLAVYGALDDAVTSTGSAEIEAIVSRYLPGSTGPNAGWYEQLLDYLGQRTPQFTEEASVPSLGQALTVLQQQGAAAAAEKLSEAETPSKKQSGEVAVESATVTGAAKKPSGRAGVKKAGKKAAKRAAKGADGSGGDASGPRPLSTVQKARTVFAIGTLSQLPGWYLRKTLGDSWADQLSQALGVAGGSDSSQLLDFLRLHLNNREGYPKVVELAADKGLIDLKVALVPLCQPKLMTVRGYPCLVITTEFESPDVSLTDLKNVIDPVNWDKCLSTFFCSTQEKDQCDDGWSRVFEQVSTTCWLEQMRMKTPLKYWKSEDQDEQQPPTACVEYALDDKPLADAKGDGLIVVDEGFIRMTSTDEDATKKGVRVRTRKVVGFRNSALTPWGVLACSMGYGDQGIDMLLDGVALCAAESGKGWTAWSKSEGALAGGPTGAENKPAQSAPTADTDTSRRAVELAVEMLNEYIDDTSKKSAAIAAKWASGVMPIAETMALSADLASRLAIDPWRYLERLRSPARGGDK